MTPTCKGSSLRSIALIGALAASASGCELLVGGGTPDADLGSGDAGADPCGPCTPPLHATSVCDGAACDFRCDANYVRLGMACVAECSSARCPDGTHCDSTSKMCLAGCLDDGDCGPNQTCNNLPMLGDNQCYCDPGYHFCSTACVPVSTSSCGATCQPCPSAPAHGKAVCRSGGCDFECDSGYSKSGASCVLGDRNWAMWPVPAESPASYALTADTVSDGVTGLVWQRTVSRKPDLAAAAGYCDTLTLGGAGDWRLPTLIELRSIVDSTKANPAIDSTAFPGTPPYQYWTAGLSTQSAAADGWILDFKDGGAQSAKLYAGDLYVRCVRGGSTPTAELFTATADTVTYHWTGLTWQRNPPDQSVSLAQGTAYCEGLALAGSSSWRLPTKKELETLLDFRSGAYNSAIDEAAFPNMPGMWFLTSTPEAGSTLFWTVNLNNGIVGTGDVSTGGQSAVCVH